MWVILVYVLLQSDNNMGEFLNFLYFCNRDHTSLSLVIFSSFLFEDNHLGCPRMLHYGSSHSHSFLAVNIKNIGESERRTVTIPQYWIPY